MQDNDGAVARLHNVLLLVVYRYGLLSSCRLHPFDASCKASCCSDARYKAKHVPFLRFSLDLFVNTRTLVRLSDKRKRSRGKEMLRELHCNVYRRVALIGKTDDKTGTRAKRRNVEHSQQRACFRFSSRRDFACQVSDGTISLIALFCSFHDVFCPIYTTK